MSLHPLSYISSSQPPELFVCDTCTCVFLSAVVPPIPGLHETHPPDEPHGAWIDGQQNEFFGRGGSPTPMPAVRESSPGAALSGI